MTETYGQKSEATGIWGEEEPEKLRTDPNGSQDVRRFSEGDGSQRVSLNREGSEEGTGAKSAIGGILYQLIEDARKQLGKSRECVIWYQQEVKENEEKLQNLTELLELQRQEEREGIQGEKNLKP